MPACPNFFIVTGGPGAGKTAIVERLAARGFPTVAEPGRAILAEQAAIGGTAVHGGDAVVAFRDLMLQRDVAAFLRMADGDTDADVPVFFDRGIPDLIGYCRLIGVPVADHVRRAADTHRYSDTVFVPPPWREIYVQDALRSQDWDEAVRTYELIAAAYAECGYRTVAVPKAPVAERANFVLAAVDALGA